MTPEIAALVKTAESAFSSAGIVTSRLDAELLLAHHLGCERPELIVHDKLVPSNVLADFSESVRRRSLGEPVAYIIGSQAFWNHDFLVSTDTLIPRQDTETLVEVALKHIRKDSRILDLGTGTGCILLSLLDEEKSAHGVGVDMSAGALKMAQENAKRTGTHKRVSFVKSDWFAELSTSDGLFDVIVSNPPYIASDDLEITMKDVREFEPVQALDGGADGLAPYRFISETAPSFLVPGGFLAVEVGVLQANDVFDMFQQAGFSALKIYRDLPGIERVVCGQKSN
jgi:release factor glutamine methyltransferase